ncbi:integrase catalytic domain-containing protein [Trichonephila clavipes]|nr:integrase catalytic domain-containing protein [Trichonephila clavipes]
MGNLPKERVRENFPFDCNGIDFIGPFWIKSNKQRKSSLYKTYVSIFLCFVTKAVHFELVSDLTTQTFIASLKRFIARRGRPSLIFSDNGKTFIGANAELKRLHILVINPDLELAGFLVDENINWKFLLPRAPNFGGLWEAGIKSLKFHFKREAGNSRFTYEEFLTIITQIEGILNSRPHPFVNGYRRFRSEWKFEKDNARVGDLVLIKEDNLAVNKWLMGRLIEVFMFPSRESNPDLMIGDPFIPGAGKNHLCQPSDVAVLTSGHFFVSDGYCNSRVLMFSPGGKLLREIGARENSLAVLNHKILEANSQVQNVKLGGHQTCLSINRLWHELCDMLRRLVGTTAPGHHDCSIQE